MQLKEFGVSLGDLIHEFNFEVVYGPEGFEKTEITKDDVNRPGLQLAGFFDYFDPNRIQIMGTVRIEIIKKSCQLQTGTVYVVLGDLGLFKALRTVNDLKIEFMDQIAEADTEFF